MPPSKHAMNIDDQDDKDDEVISVGTDASLTLRRSGKRLSEGEYMNNECSYSVFLTEALLREVRARPEVRQVTCE